MQVIDNKKEIVQALATDPRFEFKSIGDYFQKGKCPECGKQTLFVSKKEPWRVSCNRQNKCNFSESTRDLYSDLFSNYSERHPATPQNPNATANAYLAENRQFPITEMAGWYEQGTYEFRKTRVFCDTVRFYLNSDKTLYWERLIDKEKDDGQRINFGGERHKVGDSYVFKDPLKGKWWMPPTQKIDRGDHIFWVEGIFHCLAMHFSGYKAIASLAAGYFPGEAIKPYLGKNITWILALDDDPAGRRNMLKHGNRLRDMGEKVKVVLTGSKYDWDELFRLCRITDKFLLDAEYRGEMFTAKSPIRRAYALYKWKRRSYTLIDFDNRLYSMSVDTGGLEKSLEGRELTDGFGFEPFSQNCKIKAISNFYPDLLYVERDDILDEKFYVFNVAYNSGNPSELLALEGSNIDTPASFHKAMINKGYGTFSGHAKDMNILHDRWLGQRIKEIKSIPYVGYHKDSDIYVFQQFAYRKGEKLKMNDEGYFETPNGGIKTSFKGFKIEQGEFNADWINNYITAFSWQGLTALSFWLGSLFVQQIRANHKSFPFLELTGEPGAGKSTVIEFLWKLLGRDEYEGFDAMKATPAGRRRGFTQSANMPLVLIESDRGDEPDSIKKKQFDFDELKPMYNGRAVGTLGVAKRGNDTEEPLFLNTLVFAQNAEVDGSEALIQRIVHCHCTTEHHSPETRSMARWFERQTAGQMAGFLDVALAKEKDILNTYFTEFLKAEENFTKRNHIKSSNLRLVKTHAQIVACSKALKHIFPTLTDKTLDHLQEYIYSRALSRQERLVDDHPLVAEFWEIYEYLNVQRDPDSASGTAMIEMLNHSAKKPRIAINLNHFDEMCRQHGQKQLDFKVLKKLLKGSRKYKFVERGPVRSVLNNKTMNCWQFIPKQSG